MHSRPTFAATLAALLLVTGACSDGRQPSSDKEATSGSPSPAASPGKVIHYGKKGVTIEDKNDVSKLRGAPEDFKAFIAGLIEDVTIEEECEYGPPSYSVFSIDPQGYAAGDFWHCGGHYIIWASVAGHWKEVLAGQDHPMCDDLTRLSVPKEILSNDAIGDTCYDADTKPVPYQP
jgi:hypothetical protein